MNNKTLFLLLLFLFPFTTQCMQRDNTLSDKLHSLYVEAAYGYSPRKDSTSYLEHRLHRETRWGLQFINIEEHSVLSAIAIEKIALKEKQELIQKIKIETPDLIPTLKDKKFATIELWERSKPIITKILLIRNTDSFTNTFPNDIINFISLLMLQTEKPLF